MLAAQRQSRIVELVKAQGAVSVSELVGQFGVSDMTIRRDLDALADQSMLVKVHGGAVRTASLHTDEPGFDAKSVLMEEQKAAVATRAAQQVRPGMAVALSAGTTTWALAQRLTSVENLTVMTNSTRISDVFQASPRADRTVILTGGLRTRSDALVGPLAVTSLQGLHLDIAFLGVHGMTVASGLTTPNILEAETNRALLATAERRVVVSDSSKWGLVGIATFAQWDDIHAVIVDDLLDQEAIRALRQEVGEVIVAP